MPVRPEGHLAREGPEILAEFELLQIPRVGRDELDRVQGPRADRSLVLDRLLLPICLRLAEQLDRLRPGGLDLQALQGSGGVRHPTAFIDRLHGLEPQLPEELEVHHVPIGADHRGAAPELRLRRRMRDDGHLVSVDRDAGLLPVRRREALVVRMDDDRATRGEELGSGRRDRDVALVEGEGHPDEFRCPLLVVDVRLREGRQADGTPEGRTFPPVEEVLRPELEEDRLAVRPVLVGIRVVDSPEVRGHPRADGELEEPVSDPLDLLSTGVDERLPIPLMEWLPGLTFDRPLDVDPVPVEAEREQHGLAEHPLAPSDHVDHRVRHDGADVPRAARVGWRRVDDVDRLSRGRVEAVEVRLRLPRGENLFLEGGLPGFLLQRRLSHEWTRWTRSGPIKVYRASGVASVRVCSRRLMWTSFMGGSYVEASRSVGVPASRPPGHLGAGTRVQRPSERL